MRRDDPGITFGHRGAFWVGTAAVTLAVVLDLPMYLSGRDRGYRLVGMHMDAPMMIGTVLMALGLAVSLWGLVPRDGLRSPAPGRRLRIGALDDVPLRWDHIALLLVMAAAVTIDVIKPTTLAFVLPGMAREYGLRSPVNPTGTVPAALLPLSGILGTVLGSFIWGWLGDRVGRRASILMAAVTFIGTSACGSMPAYWMNVVMCFIMGLGVGGMLPIMFTITAEAIPARHRGWLLVLLGGDVAGAYIITSWLASALVPTYSWRMLWLIGLPSGVALMLLNRWIPESPRFLLAQGQVDEARRVMERYGATVVEETAAAAPEATLASTSRQLVQRPFAASTAIIVLLAVGVGLVSFGFQLWMPSNLQRLGFGEAEANRLLRNSALIGYPLNFVVAWAYGVWSSKRTLVILTALTAVALLGFVLGGDAVVANRTLLYALLVMPIWGISSVVAVLSAYSAEVFPTRLRSRGSGLAAGFSKAGGVLIIALVAVSIAPPSISGTALIGAVPMAVAALAVAVFGLETRQRRLEEITAEQLRAPGAEPALGT